MAGQEQKKEREHRPTRKASLSMEHAVNREKLAEETAQLAASAASPVKTEVRHSHPEPEPEPEL